jgi:hypothetical protein
VNGELYVNPKGQGTRKVDISLVCVDTVSNHPSGYNLLARFQYVNPNNSPVYVPLGPDNFLTSATGGWSGNPPVIFKVGTWLIQIPFDGDKLTWTLRSYNGNQKAGAASEASSTSNKCSAHLRGAQLPVSGSESIVLYPNPTQGNVQIESTEDLPVNTKVLVFDLMGKQQAVEALITDSRQVKLDMTALPQGIYIVNVQGEGVNQIFRVVKY